MRRVLVAVMLVGSLLATLTPTAVAGEEWCEDDPPVVIQTPGGSTVVLYVTNGAKGHEHLLALTTAKISYTVKPLKREHATLVKLEVLVPGDHFDSRFRTRSVVTARPMPPSLPVSSPDPGPVAQNTIFDRTHGHSGQVMRLEFKLNVP